MSKSVVGIAGAGSPSCVKAFLTEHSEGERSRLDHLLTLAIMRSSNVVSGTRYPSRLLQGGSFSVLPASSLKTRQYDYAVVDGFSLDFDGYTDDLRYGIWAVNKGAERLASVHMEACREMTFAQFSAALVCSLGESSTVQI
ncbi:MAG: hypothetical protein GAK45_00235 [Pseudomonas citronellolis]|nr:MAG: hypothetical protein GAK45_00235 [Pseudomonas citronellolis]